MSRSCAICAVGSGAAVEVAAAVDVVAEVGQDESGESGSWLALAAPTGIGLSVA